MKKMMMMAVAAAACVAFGQAPAAPAHRMLGPRGGMQNVDGIVRMVSNPKFAEQIGLTAEQKAKINDLQKTQRDEMKKTGEAMRAAMTKKAELLNAAKVDEAAVMAAIDEIGEVRKQMDKAQAKKIIAVKALLSPEQMEKALVAMKEFRGGPSRRVKDAKPAAKPAAEAKPIETKPAAAPEKK